METKKKSTFIIEVILAAMMAAIFLYLCLNSVCAVDSDNYWQLAHGRKMLESGLYTDEPLSMHEGLKFVYPQWLSVLIFTIIHNIFGIPGVDIWYRAIQLIGVYFLYKLVKMLTDNDYIAAVLGSMFFVSYSITTYSTRPFVISQTLIAIELYLLEKYIKTKNEKLLYWLPLMSCAWINFHNSLWLFMYIMMMPMIAEYLYCMWRKKDRPFAISPLIIMGAVSEMTALVNPYGVDYILYLIKSANTVTGSTDRIIELNRAVITNVGVITLVVTAILVACIVIVYYKKTETEAEDGVVYRPAVAPVRYWLLFGGTFVLAMLHIRNITVFFIGTAPIIGYYAAQIRPIPKDNAVGRVFGKSLVILFIAFSALCITSDNSKEISAKEDDQGAIEYMEENVEKGSSVFATINSGALLELYGYKPFVDTRLEVFSEELNGQNNYLSEYWDLYMGIIWPGDFLEDYDFDIFYIEKDYLPSMHNYLANTDGFECVYEDDTTAIFKYAE